MQEANNAFNSRTYIVLTGKADYSSLVKAGLFRYDNTTPLPTHPPHTNTYGFLQKKNNANGLKKV
jgi:hypothetical protein